MFLAFKTIELANTWLFEIAVTPFDGVILWAGQSNFDFAFDSTPNVVDYCKAQDGRVAIEHSFGELDAQWLEAYLAEPIATGDVAIYESRPIGWVDQVGGEI